MKRFNICIIIVVLLAACGRQDRRVSVDSQLTTHTVQTQTPVKSGQTLNQTATSEAQTAITVAGTEEAERGVYEQSLEALTLTSVADPRPTADENNPPPLPTYPPKPTREFRLFTHDECEATEPRGSAFISNCWHGIIDGQDLWADARGVRAEDGSITNVGFLSIRMGRYGETIDYHYPYDQGYLTITSVAPPRLLVMVGTTTRAQFDLGTRQWLNANGTPLPTMPTATPTCQ